MCRKARTTQRTPSVFLQTTMQSYHNGMSMLCPKTLINQRMHWRVRYEEIVTIKNSLLFMALSIHSFSSHSLFQSHFTTHSFRFAEVCCTKEPPKGVRALLYRTAVPEWGECFIIIRIDISSLCIKSQTNGCYFLLHFQDLKKCNL